MYFDKRNFYGCKRIAQRNAGVRICCRIDDDEIGLILACRLYTVDEFAFVNALEGDAMRHAFCCQACKMLSDIGQCLPSVDIWHACAEQIQTGAVHDKVLLRHYECFVTTERRFTINTAIYP